MSEPINVEARVDELSKPENKSELNNILNAEFNAGTQQPEAKTEEAAPAEQAKPAEEKIGTEDNKGGNADDPSKNAGEAETRKSKVAELLADKNAANGSAAEAQTEVQILSKRVEDLTKLLEKSVGKGSEAATGNGGADDLNTEKPIAQQVTEEIAKIEQQKQAIIDAEKSLDTAVQALEENKDTPNAKDFKEEIKMVMKKFPSMSAVGAYGFLVGNDVIPKDVLSPSNANRTGTGNRSKTTLLDNKKPEDMSQAEAFAYLKQEEKAGNLKGQI